MTDTLEQNNTPEQPKKKGRKGNPNYLTFEEAKQVVQDELIPSRSKYLEWWDANQPKTLPRFPNRVYKQWITWNDFLGTNNKFQEVGKKWRAFEEAIQWAHTLGLKTRDEWLQWCKENELPVDIPTRPDMVYKKWISWGHWVGNKPKKIVEAKQMVERIRLYYIIRHNDVPTNVFTFGIEDGGFYGLKERWERDRFDIIKTFWYDSTKSAIVNRIVGTLSSPYQGDEGQRLAPNIHDIIWYLQMHLETAIPT